MTQPLENLFHMLEKKCILSGFLFFCFLFFCFLFFVFCFLFCFVLFVCLFFCKGSLKFTEWTPFFKSGKKKSRWLGSSVFVHKLCRSPQTRLTNKQVSLTCLENFFAVFLFLSRFQVGAKHRHIFSLLFFLLVLFWCCNVWMCRWSKLECLVALWTSVSLVNFQGKTATQSGAVHKVGPELLFPLIFKGGLHFLETEAHLLC